MDGIYLRCNLGGEYENVAILVAIAVNKDGFREVLVDAERMKEDKANWVSFFQWLRGRGLDGVKLIVGDKCMGVLEAVGEVFPDENSALMLVCAMLHHVAETQRGNKIHEHEALRGNYERSLYCRLTSFSRSPQTFLRKSLTVPSTHS